MPKSPPRGVVGEFVEFIRYRKAYWLIPLGLVFLLLAALITLGSTAAAPFIYTLF